MNGYTTWEVSGRESVSLHTGLWTEAAASWFQFLFSSVPCYSTQQQEHLHGRPTEPPVAIPFLSTAVCNLLLCVGAWETGTKEEQKKIFKKSCSK